jgi:hypothetical protein
MDDHTFRLHLKSAKNLNSENELVNFLHSRLTHGDVFRYAGYESARVRSSYNTVYEIASDLNKYSAYTPNALRGSFSTDFFEAINNIEKIDIKALAENISLDGLKGIFKRLTNLTTPPEFYNEDLIALELKDIVCVPWTHKSWEASRKQAKKSTSKMDMFKDNVDIKPAEERRRRLTLENLELALFDLLDTSTFSNEEKDHVFYTIALVTKKIKELK